MADCGVELRCAESLEKHCLEAILCYTLTKTVGSTAQENINGEFIFILDVNMYDTMNALQARGVSEIAVFSNIGTRHFELARSLGTS